MVVGRFWLFEAGYPRVLNEGADTGATNFCIWQKVKLDDYRYDDLNVNNDLDNQLTASLELVCTGIL